MSLEMDDEGKDWFFAQHGKELPNLDVVMDAGEEDEAEMEGKAAGLGAPHPRTIVRFASKRAFLGGAGSWA